MVPVFDAKRGVSTPDVRKSDFKDGEIPGILKTVTRSQEAMQREIFSRLDISLGKEGTCQGRFL